MIYIGIDNGKKGAIALIFEPGVTTVWPQPMIGDQPNEQEMWDLVPPNKVMKCFACIEKSQAMSRMVKGKLVHQPPRSTHASGKLHGLWLMALVGRGIPRQIIPPKTWQAVMLLGEDKSDTKAASIRVAKRLFPGVSLLPTERCHKDSDGMADALLLAEFARRTHLGERNG